MSSMRSDDIYSGFNDYNPEFERNEIANDPAFQQAIKTGHGKRPPPTAKARNLHAKSGMSVPTSSLGRMGTSVSGDSNGARPMTAVRAAGFTSYGGKPTGGFESGNDSPASSLQPKREDTPEEKIKILERKVATFIDESCLANSRGEYELALEKAKEAGRKERFLAKQRDQMLSSEQVNLDLTYSVLFNLAEQYEANEMYSEALNTYQAIVRNKLFNHGGRLKVNMGNIYFRQKNYSKAVKFYRMALDQVPTAYQEMRIKIMQNIGIVFVKLGQYNDAITSFEHIMSEDPTFKTGFNLILCYFALGDLEKMKRAFIKLLTVERTDDDDKYISHPDDKQINDVVEIIRNDSLRQFERKRKLEAERFIKLSAKVIAPAIDVSFARGYDWCIEQVKLSPYIELANDLEIDKSIMFLKEKEFGQAIETLKSFEKKDSKVKVILGLFG